MIILFGKVAIFKKNLKKFVNKVLKHTNIKINLKDQKLEIIFNVLNYITMTGVYYKYRKFSFPGRSFSAIYLNNTYSNITTILHSKQISELQRHFL